MPHKLLILVSLIYHLSSLISNVSAQTPVPLEGYGVEYAPVTDFTRFHDWNANLVLFSFHGVSSSQWANVYNQAIANNIKLIAQYWDGWNTGGGAWQMLEFINQNESYKQATFAVYTLHEPCNPQNPPSSLYNRTQRVAFYNQIRTQYPWVKTYSEGEVDCPDYGTGEADYTYTDMYNFATVNGQAVWNNGRGTVLYTQAEAEAAALNSINTKYQKIHNLGSTTKLTVLIQTYAINPSSGTIWNRMPTANEMLVWANIAKNSGQVSAIMWYSWNPAASFYQYYLSKDRYDPAGADRWQAASDFGHSLINSIPGDANGDNVVDGVDYVIWLNHYKQTGSGGPGIGDFNSSGLVDGVDYVIWLNNYAS